MGAEYLPIGCFGKLPFNPEHLQGQLFYPSSLAFRDWVREGRQEGVREGEVQGRVELRERFAYRFLFNLPRAAELVAGVIRPSADAKGRAFPFAVFIHLPRRFYGRNYSMLPLGLSGAWDALDDVWENVQSAPTLSAFEEILGSSLVPLPPGVGDIRGTYGSGMDQPIKKACPDCLIEQFPSLVAEIRKSTEEEGLVVELPVGAEAEHASFGSSFWMEYVNHFFTWRRYEPSLFLDDSPLEDYRRALLLFGRMSPYDYPLIMGSEGAVRTVWRPALPPTGGSDPHAGGHGEVVYSSLMSRRALSGA